jgi:hypothetical protein
MEAMMARRPRVALPGPPVYVVHRSNVRQAVFYTSETVFAISLVSQMPRGSIILIHAQV